MNTAVIFNPTSGRADDFESLVDQIVRGDGAELFSTDQSGDAHRSAEEAADLGAERILVCGGDGTVNEVVNALGSRPSAPPLVIVAAGTGNDFARTLHIEIESSPPMDFNVDGESIDGTALDIQIRPAALTLLVPANE